MHFHANMLYLPTQTLFSTFLKTVEKKKNWLKKFKNYTKMSYFLLVDEIQLGNLLEGSFKILEQLF